MIRIGPAAIALSSWIVLSVYATLLSAPAQAAGECVVWDMRGEWNFVQSNDTIATLTLGYEGNGIQGSARHLTFGGFVTGSVDGLANGDSLELTVYWNNGTTGVYSGKIGPQGRITGTGYDAQHPNTMANFYSDRTAKCFQSAVAPVPPSSTELTVKPQGRVTGPGGPTTSLLTICEAAQQARARNSPAAPGLEAKCRAEGVIRDDPAALIR